MRYLISIVMILALVITTSFASLTAHAMPHDSAVPVKAESTEAAKGHDCHGHGEAKADANKTVQNDKGASDKCCDKGMCKCIGGTCHNGLSQFLGNGGVPLLSPTASNSVFGFDNQFVDSALPSRLKRPPRA